MSYQESIATPGSHLEPPGEDYCEDCDDYGDDCECDEYYIEERSDD